MFNICYNNLALDLAVESFGNAAEIGLQFIQRITKRVINMYKHPLPKQTILNNLFSYNSATGYVVRKLATSRNTNIGDDVGSMKPHGYMTVDIYGIRYYLHRIIWKLVTGVDPDFIDHKNGIRSDNRLSNLREATSSQNNHNRHHHPRNTSGCVGVDYRPDIKKWRTRICVNYNHINVGYFEDKKDAIQARKNAELKYRLSGSQN